MTSNFDDKKAVRDTAPFEPSPKVAIYDRRTFKSRVDIGEVVAASPSKQVFLVVAESGAEKVAERLNNLGIPLFKVADNSWFVAYSGTASEAADDFGLRINNVVGSGVVVSVNNYGGRANPDTWEWLKLNWPANA